jgi:hypothetical protein
VDPEAVRARGAPHEPERILDVDSVSLGENPLGLLDDDAAVERLLQLGRASREHACQLEQAACDTRASRLHSRVMWPMKRSRSSGSAFAPDSSACAAPDDAGQRRQEFVRGVRDELLLRQLVAQA